MLEPNSTERADNCGPEVEMVTEFDDADVAFLDVVTLKCMVPLLDGASALKSTSTFWPALKLHLLDNSTVTPVAAAAPAPPTPAVPAWMHVPPMMSTLVGVEPREVEGVTVTESPLGPDRVEGRSKVTAKFANAGLSHRRGRGRYPAHSARRRADSEGIGRHVRVGR